MPHQFLPDIRINTPNDLHTVLLAFRANKNILNAITREYVHLLTAPMDMPDGRYIIHEAALGGHVYLIRAIIKQAAMAHPAIDMRDDRGWTPMHYVCNFSDSRYLAAARVLVEYPPAIGRNAADVGGE
jgi:ankyrin repeat protein